MAVIGAWGDQATMQPSARATAVGLLEAAILAAQNAAGSVGGQAGAIAGAAAGVAAVQPLLAQADQAKDDALEAARLASSERAIAAQFSERSRVNAVISAESSGSAQGFAQLAASSAAMAMVDQKPFASISAGLAAVAEGETFAVYGSALGVTNAFAIAYRKVSNAAVYIDTYPNKAAYDAVQPSAARAYTATELSKSAALPNFIDRMGGASMQLFDHDNAQAAVDLDADGVFASTDTLNKRRTDSYDQSFEGDVSVGGTVGAANRLHIGGSLTQTEILDRPVFRMLLAAEEVHGPNGLIIGMDPSRGLYMGPVAPIPQIDGTFWRRANGTLGVFTKVGWYTGKRAYTPEVMPPPQCILRPLVKYPDEAPELGTRVYILIPSICKKGNRLFFAWCGDAVHAEEGAGNFIILAYSDDGGLTKTEFAYILHPEPDLGRTMMPQLWLDLQSRLQLVFSMNYAFSGVAGGDDRHGAWCMPIDFEMGAKPRCGRAWQVSTYGIPGRPSLVDDRMLINIDLVENPSSGLPVAGPIAEWRGKSIFEIDTSTRSAEKVGRIVNSVAYASYQECSTVQLRDGSLLTSFRTRTPGGMTQIARSPTGEPSGYGDVENWSALPPNPGTRSALVMSANGRPVVAWNSDATQRTNMTLGILNDGGTALIASVLIDQLSGSSSYPSIWCDGDDIYVVYDVGRTSNKQIIMVRVSESALLAGAASPEYFTIEDQ